MDSYPKKDLNNISNKEKLLFDINNSLNSTLEENEYCPHIFDHFLNPYMNSIFKKILISPQQSNSTDKNKDKDIIYSHNSSLFQNSFLSHIYWSYPQFLNLFDLFLLKNLSLNHLLYSNPQNLPMNTINKDSGCIFTLNFSDTGNIMCASNPKNLEIWDVGKKRLKKVISDHKEIVSDAVFLHGEDNNNNFLTGSLDRTIKLYRNFENVHTFYEHNDWVRALNISYDNNYFLSGCVSSVVKLWDLNKKIVINTIINQNENQNFMNTVNSLSFFRTNPNLFLIGYRSGDIKICDIRANSKNTNALNQLYITQSFKAHSQKLNTAKLNQSDRYILTSGRDSTLRLWDIRKISNGKNNSSYNINNTNDYSRNYINEYNYHRCTGYNVECNYYQEEKYLITGSETGSIIIYDIFNPNKYKEIKTHLKCVNLVKQIPNNSNAIAFAGLAENAVFIYDSNKNIMKFYDKDGNNFSEEENNFIDDEDDIGKDKSQELCNNIIEEIMKEHGDVILKTFHKNNMTYNNGINFANFLQMMQNGGEGNSSQKIIDLFFDKIKNILYKIETNNMNKKNKKEEKKEKKKENVNVPKRNVKCSECELKNNNEYKNDENNIFNCVDKEQMKQLLILPNNFEFNVLNEI